MRPALVVGRSRGTGVGVSGSCICSLADRGGSAGSAPANLAAIGGPSGLRGTIDNAGLFESGATVKVRSLTNTGTLSPFGAGTIGTTAIAGDFVHRRSGELSVDIDALAGNGQTDLVTVGGDAVIRGAITPVARNLLPGRYAVVSARFLEQLR